jgi:2-polyprenyl-6-methoxyphenol hydroxylase-like FAD-dependent oxidoreductase
MDHSVDCVIAGGGPAGLMLGVLLARAGVSVAVLEKHCDFLRDFRGDTIHPSTMQVMAELGWLDEFLKIPHEPVSQLVGQFGQTRFILADFSHLRVPAPYIAMMPQWDFLNFLASKGRGYPGFQLFMETEATDLIGENGCVSGVAAHSPSGTEIFRAALTVAADGRTSRLRDCAGLTPLNLGAPMDVLWFRLPRLPGDTKETQGRFDAGRIFIMLNRGDYWQCAFVIPKGQNDAVRARGIEAFRASVGMLLPFEASRSTAITDWEQVRLLTVAVDRLQEWAKPGLLFIGDAAHAMSPIGGVGVNLAIQDAVAAANLLAAPLRDHRLTLDNLKAVERRRLPPTQLTQRVQVLAQNAIISRALSASELLKPPMPLRVLSRMPGFTRLTARLIGLGVRPEHIDPSVIP